MRERTEDGTTVVVPGTHGRVGGADSGVLTHGPDQIATTNITSGYRHMRDIVTPKFRERSAAGEVINNPMYRIESDEELTLSHYVHIYGTHTNAEPGEDTFAYYYADLDPRLLCGNPSVSHPLEIVDRQRLINLAVTGAHAEANRGVMMLYVTLAESKKTYNSVVDILQRIFKILLAVKKLDVKALKREISPSELKDRYLEARYAIRPLIIDCEGLIEALHAKIDNKRQTFRAGEADIQTSTLTGTFNASGVRNTHWVSNCTEVVEVRGGVLVDIAMDESQFTTGTWGFDQVPESALELVPWSFVVNWFFNIGDLVASWSPKAGMKTLASWYVISSVRTETFSISGNECVWSEPEWTGTSMSLTPGLYRNTVTTQERVVDPTRPLMPSLKINLDFFKIVDLMAFAHTILRRK